MKILETRDTNEAHRSHHRHRRRRALHHVVRGRYKNSSAMMQMKQKKKNLFEGSTSADTMAAQKSRKSITEETGVRLEDYKITQIQLNMIVIAAL